MFRSEIIWLLFLGHRYSNLHFDICPIHSSSPMIVGIFMEPQQKMGHEKFGPHFRDFCWHRGIGLQCKRAWPREGGDSRFQRNEIY